MSKAQVTAMAEHLDDSVPGKRVLPPTTVEAVRLARRLTQARVWTQRMLVNAQPRKPIAFSAHMARRFNIIDAPGTRALHFVKKLIPDPLPIGESELTVSPYAPPMRQLSSVRQGVPMWSGRDVQRTAPSTQAAARPSTPARLTAGSRQDTAGKIPDDLQAILNMHRALGNIK